MLESKFDMSPVEPAHPMVIKFYDDLVTIYSHIRKKYQQDIDKTFDSISQQIGFVVTATVPVKLDIDAKGTMKGGIIIEGKPFKGTLFDRELTKTLKALSGDSIADVSSGTYRLYLIWFEALKLKLRTDWMEPAHFVLPVDIKMKIKKLGEILTARQPMEDIIKPKPWPGDPPHWFDPGTIIEAEERVLISAIDEVYPELRLVDRIASYRRATGSLVLPEVKEPAHFRRTGPISPIEGGEDILSEIAALLRRYGY